MDPLQVDLPELRLLAQRCRDWSALLDHQPPPALPASISAAAAAVAMVQSELCAAGATLTVRMRQTAALLEDAARRVESGESDWAAAFTDPKSGA